MHIKRLARKAVFITAAIMVLAGFTTSVAATASAAPTSHVSAVSAAAPARTTVPEMPQWCPGQFCALGQLGRYLGVVQAFGCTINQIHTAVNGNDVYEMVNNCGTAVDYYYNGGSTRGCVNAHSAKAGVGRFPNISYYWVSFDASC
jgi:hypothetical protein